MFMSYGFSNEESCTSIMNISHIKQGKDSVKALYAASFLFFYASSRLRCAVRNSNYTRIEEIQRILGNTTQLGA